MATIDESPSAKRWLPLEANPDVMNQVWSFCSDLASRFELCLVEREFGVRELKKSLIFYLDYVLLFGWDVVSCCVFTFSWCISIRFLCRFVHFCFLVVELRRSLLVVFFFIVFTGFLFSFWKWNIVNCCFVWASSILLKWERNVEEDMEIFFPFLFVNLIWSFGYEFMISD